MSLKNRYKLWKLKQNLTPSRDFKVKLQRDLNSAWNVLYGRPSWLQISLLHKGMAFAMIVLLLAGGTGAYAYVNPEVTEGTVLYPVKQAVEKVEEAPKITPQAKTKFYLKQIKRREAEKARLVRKSFRQSRPASGIIKKDQTEQIVVATTTQFKQRVKEAKIKSVNYRLRKTEESIERAKGRLEKFQKQREEKIEKQIKKQRERKGRYNE